MSIDQIMTALPGQINIVLLLCLMAVGFIIKHTAIFAKVSNNLIPIIVVVIALVFTLITGDLSTTNGVVNAIMSGFINAALAVWAHQAGKNVFELLGTSNKDGPTSDSGVGL